MGSYRTRLTLSYLAVLLGALVVLALVVLVARRDAVGRQLEERVRLEAEQVVRAVNLARSAGTDPLRTVADPLAAPTVSRRMEAFLALLDGYVLVQDSARFDIYASPSVQALGVSDRDRFSYEAVYSADRIRTPQVRDAAGNWKETDWQTALAAVADRLKALAPERVGFLANPSSTLEELGLLERIARGLGSANLDHRLRQLDRQPGLPVLRYRCAYSGARAGDPGRRAGSDQACCGLRCGS